MSILVVGLGNPGKTYEKTHHNAGFLAVDFLLTRLRQDYGDQASDFRENKKLKSLVAEINFQEVNNPLLTKIVNPIMKIYLAVCKQIIFW